MEEELKSRVPDNEIIIRLDREATFVDLFEALDEIEEEIMNGEAGEGIDTHDPTGFYQELHDNIDPEVVEEVLDFQTRLDALWHKDPEQYDPEEKKLASLGLLDYFQSKGYPIDDIEAYLPIKFEKEK